MKLENQRLKSLKLELNEQNPESMLPGQAEKYTMGSNRNQDYNFPVQSVKRNKGWKIDDFDIGKNCPTT